MSGDIHVVMGVAGSGKSRVGAALAHALGVAFIEGDDFHPSENVRRMAAGIPLTDDDRAGWLRALAARIREARDAGIGAVVACSALKRVYRDLLREQSGVHDLRFILLRGDESLIAQRLTSRQGHFMPATLLASQLATLEPPSPDESAWVVDVTEPVESIVASLIERIGNGERK